MKSLMVPMRHIQHVILSHSTDWLGAHQTDSPQWIYTPYCRACLNDHVQNGDVWCALQDALHDLMNGFSLEKDVKIKFQYRLKQCKSNMRYCKPKKCISISTAYTLNSNIKINFALFDLVPHHMNFIIVQVLMLISIVLNLTNIDCHWVDWLISIWAGKRF